MSQDNAARNEINFSLDIIPQRAPFLMVDKIMEGEPGQFATSSYRVQPDNPVFIGHFPDSPIFPGVLVIENMAQTACWVCAATASDEPALYVLVRVNQCTFQNMVKPGDELITTARLSRMINQFAQFDCEVCVAGGRVAKAELLVARQTKTQD